MAYGERMSGIAVSRNYWLKASGQPIPKDSSQLMAEAISRNVKDDSCDTFGFIEKLLSVGLARFRKALPSF